MKIQFIGATRTVTGSKYLVEKDGKNFLVDCGLFQGLKDLRLNNWNPLPVDPKSIEAVILTHAHIDHSGYLPLLVKNGFRGKIYSTKSTASLCKILLPDAGHLQEEDANFLNRHKLSRHKPALPLYFKEDAIKSLDYFNPVDWQKRIPLTPNLSFEFFPAGHIVGAAMVRFVSSQCSLTFTGDIGRPHNIIMPPPHPIPETNYLVVESTYGDRTHPIDDPREILKTLISGTVKQKGIVLIPSFAVGRAQEILYLIHQLKKRKAIPDIPVYLNSPMSVEATKIYCDFEKEHRMSPEDCKAICEMTQFVTTVEESKRLNTRTEPCIIISASGMATGGRILHHLKVLAPNPKNLILFVGFQAAGTRGNSIVHGSEYVKIHGEMIPIKAKVASLDALSAHADAHEILDWLGKAILAPKMIFITHGEPLASEALKKRIKENLGFNCKIPAYLEKLDL